MKKYLILANLLFVVGCLYSQIVNNIEYKPVDKFCEPIKVITTYNGGNSKFSTENSGVIFPDGFYHQLHQKNLSAGIGPIGIWITGRDKAGNIYISGVDAASGVTDFFPGPTPDWSEDYHQHCSNWNRFFKVEKEEILLHVNNFRKGGANSCDKIPENIKYWPGNKNPFFKEKYKFELATNELATFVDVDSDGIYNPCAGDYPGIFPSCEIIESFPDEILFWCINDKAGLHRFSKGDAMGIHINCYMFHYKETNPVNDGIYFYFDIVNYSDRDLDDISFGLHLRAGDDCKGDRLIGVDSTNNMVYYYYRNVEPGMDTFDVCVDKKRFPYYYFLCNIPHGLTYKRFAKDAAGNVIMNEAGQPLLLDISLFDSNMEADTVLLSGLSGFQLFNQFEFENIKSKKLEAVYLLMNGYDLKGNELYYKDRRTKYMYSGNPDENGSWNMLSSNVTFNDSISAILTADKFYLQTSQHKRLLYYLGPVHRKEAKIDLSVAYQIYQDAFLKLDLGCVYYDNFLSPGANLTAIYNESKNVLSFKIDPYFNAMNIEEEKFISDIPPQLLSKSGTDYYLFEGYQVYQLKYPFMKIQDKFNAEDVRLVYQCDVQNEFDKLYWYDSEVNTDPLDQVERYWSASMRANGRNKGIVRNFELDLDHLGLNGGRLTPGQSYHYAIVSYYANQWKPFNAFLEAGQKKEYLRSHFQYCSVTIPGSSPLENLAVSCVNGKLTFSDDSHTIDHFKLYEIDGKLLWYGNHKNLSELHLNGPKLYVFSWLTKDDGWKSQKLFCE